VVVTLPHRWFVACAGGVATPKTAVAAIPTAQANLIIGLDDMDPSFLEAAVKMLPKKRVPGA
jgi:hypothetical protein